MLSLLLIHVSHLQYKTTKTKQHFQINLYCKLKYKERGKTKRSAQCKTETINRWTLTNWAHQVSQVHGLHRRCMYQEFFRFFVQRSRWHLVSWAGLKIACGWYLTLEWAFVWARLAPHSFPCAASEEDLMTAWPYSSPGRWCAAPLCCLRSQAGRRSAGQWAACRWGGCRRPARGRSVSGGLPRAGGRTVQPAWPAAAGSSPRLWACLAPAWAPCRSPPPETRWSYGAAPNWCQSSSSPVTPLHSSCMLFSERENHSEHKKQTGKISSVWFYLYKRLYITPFTIKNCLWVLYRSRSKPLWNKSTQDGSAYWPMQDAPPVIILFPEDLFQHTPNNEVS